MILCACSTSRAQNSDRATGTCERPVYFIVKITRFYDYQTWPTHLFEKFMNPFNPKLIMQILPTIQEEND